MQSHTRRFFLKTTLTGAAALGLDWAAPVARAIEPFSRKGESRLLLSLAAYSFRDFFKQNPSGGAAAQRRLDLFGFMDFCAEHGCVGAELTSYYFPSDVTEEFLLRIKRHAFFRGLEISGTAVGNTFTHPEGERRRQQMDLVKRWVDYAAIMGAPHIRVFAGTASGISKEEAIKRAIAGLEEATDYAGKKGIFLGLENHGGIVAEADAVLEIVQAVQSPWFGINLDTGNFHTDDPYGDLARCAPYAVNVQVKAEVQERGGKAGPADLPRIVKILRDANYQGYVALEYESKEDPWTAVPRLLSELKQLTGV